MEVINNAGKENLFKQLIFETVIMVIIAEFGMRILKDWFESYASKKPWFQSIGQRKGLFATNGQQDLVLVLIIMCHHGLFGGFMLLSAYQTNSKIDWFRHGALGELGFELVDLMNNLIGRYPYSEKRMSLPMRAAAIFHHIPGICLTIPLILNDIHNNSIHLRLIGENSSV